MTERNQRTDPEGSDDNNIEEMESKRRRQQQRHAELLSRIGMNKVAVGFRESKESNAGAEGPDSPMGQLWDVMPRPARDFLSAGLPEDAGADDPVLGDDSEFEDSDGIPIF